MHRTWSEGKTTHTIGSDKDINKTKHGYKETQTRQNCPSMQYKKILNYTKHLMVEPSHIQLDEDVNKIKKNHVI